MRSFISLFLVLSSLLFVLPVSVNAQANNNHTIKSIEVCLNPENNRQFNPNLITDFQFQPFKTIRLRKETRHWLRIIINNHALSEKENYIHFYNIFAEVVLWQKDPGNMWVQNSIGGYDIPYSQRSGHGFIDDKLLFCASSGDETELLVSAYQPYTDIILNDQCEVISKSKFEKKNNATNNFQFWFAGIISVLCIFSLILFLFMRNKAFIIYALYAIITEIYFLAFFNIIEANLLFDYPQINKHLFFCITLSQSLYFLFLNELLKQTNGIKKQKFVTQYALISFLAALVIIVFSLFNYQNAIHFSDIYTIVNGVVGLYIVAITYKDAPRRIRIIYIGFMSIVFSGLFALFLNFISLGNACVYIYQLGFFIELTFFFIAISYTYFIEKTSRIQTMLNLSVMETEKLKTEKKALELKSEVDQKNRNLTLKAVELSKNNELINEMIDRLGSLEEKETFSIKDITRLKRSLISTTKHDYWEEFEAHFIKVHPEFYKLLHKRYPELTTTERKLCAFIKLNLTTKEIASITKRNPESIHMTRSRLRKKMGLNKIENLENFIASIK